MSVAGRGSNQYRSWGTTNAGSRGATATFRATVEDEDRWGTPPGTFELFDEWADRSGVVSGSERTGLALRYGWSVPTVPAVGVCVANGPLVEAGAGTGYWASLIDAAGGDIVCFDRYPPGSELVSEPEWHQQQEPWFPVQVGDARTVAGYPDRTLLLSWPPYETSMGFDTVEAYTDACGRRIVFIGEGPGGACGDQRMWTLLGSPDRCWACADPDDDEAWHDCHPEIEPRWQRTSVMALPAWSRVADNLIVFDRVG